MNKQPLPFAIYDTTDADLPTLQEIGDALENYKPHPTQFIASICAWEIANVKLLETPIPAKGKQRLWNWGGAAS